MRGEAASCPALDHAATQFLVAESAAAAVGEALPRGPGLKKGRPDCVY